MHVHSTLFVAASALAAPALGIRDEPAPLLAPRDASAKLLADKYIVKMKDSAEVSVSSNKYKAAHTFNHGIKGFSAELSQTQLEEVRNDPDVEYVEQDQEINMFEYISQEGAPWGITRISHTSNGFTNYVYDSSAGEGICNYVIDTGILVDHPEFEGRAKWLINFTDDGNDGDGAGHGTWVAGLIASATYGVAKKSRVFALKVFRDDGTTDGASIIAAMDVSEDSTACSPVTDKSQYVVQDKDTRGCNGYTANMSLGGGYSQVSNDAADAMVNSGVFVSVAAGNSNVDAGQTSPASAPLVCTVGATDSNDVRAEFSSYGAVVDIWAPGVDLESTSYEGGTVSLVLK